MKAILSYVGLLVFEVAYILLVWDPDTTRTQAGLMLIFACEVAFAVRVSRAQLQLKQRSLDLLRKSRIHAAIYVVGMLLVMALGVGTFHFNGERIAVIVAFAVVAFAKIHWERMFGEYATAAATAEGQTSF